MIPESSQDAYGDHLLVMEALRARNPQKAMENMRSHLSRIQTQIRRIRAENEAYFEGEPARA